MSNTESGQKDEKCDIFSVITRAFGPNGESLIDSQCPTFDGEFGIRLLCRQGDVEAEVVISPFQGDYRKLTDGTFIEGQPVEIFCAHSLAPLKKIDELSGEDGDYFAIYLTPKLADGEQIAINNIWGKYKSQVLDEKEWMALIHE